MIVDLQCKNNINKDLLEFNLHKFLLFSLILLFQWPGQSLGQEASNDADTMATKKSKASKDSLAQDTTLTAEDTLNLSESAVDAPVEYQAKDSILFKLEEQRAYLYNKGKVNYKDMNLESGKIYMNWQNNNVYAQPLRDSTGKGDQFPKFQDDEQKYDADSILYNFQSKKGKLHGLKTKKNEGYIHGEEVKKDQRDVIFASHAKYTTCDKDHPHFYIKANKIKAIPKDKIVSGPANLVLEDVPIPAYLPFGFFPSGGRQSSGLILPGYGESRDRGFFLEGGGYYFGISDNFDLTLTGDIYTKGSWLTNTRMRYAERYRFNGQLRFRYGVSKFGDRESPDFREEREMRIKWRHQQDPKARPNSSFSADVNIAQRNTLRNTSKNVSDIVKSNLNSSINYSTSFRALPFQLSASANHSQNLQTGKLSVQLPTGNINMDRMRPFSNSDLDVLSNFNLRYRMNFKNTLNTYDTLFSFPGSLQGMDYGLKHSVPISTSLSLFKYFSLNPSINYTEYNYFERTRQVYNEEQDTVLDRQESGFYSFRGYNFSADLKTRLYGMFNINELGIRAIRHVMTPNIGFTYTPDFSKPKHNIYKTRRTGEGNIKTYNLYAGNSNLFGTPGQGRSGAINFSVQNNLEMKVRNKSDTSKETKKIKLIESFNVSTRYDIFKDTMSLSNVNFSFRTTLFDQINLQGSGTLNPYQYNRTSDTYVDQFAIKESGKLGKLTNANLSLNTSLNPEVLKGEDPKKQPMQGPIYPAPHSQYYVDFSVPWDLSLRYSLSYNQPNPNREARINQTANFSGNLKLTDKWKIGFNSGYDFDSDKLTTTSLDIHRDLHCWEMSMNWLPFGSRQRYAFKINVKSNVLQDVKFEKKEEFYDQ